MDAINIVKKWNKIAEVKQGARAFSAVSCIGIGTYLLYKFAFNNGVTYTQEFILNHFPEEYGSITNEILKVITEDIEKKGES